MAAREATNRDDINTKVVFERMALKHQIIIFFLHGESYLGMGCCSAIWMITDNCWPSMLSSLGFTAKEGDILEGYCGAIVTMQPASGDGGAVHPVGPMTTCCLRYLRDLKTPPKKRLYQPERHQNPGPAQSRASQKPESSPISPCCWSVPERPSPSLPASRNQETPSVGSKNCSEN
ncbi:Egg cell-secreted protein 1-1 [Nymphaea thermarum]|nr:Egg cell-secreted protein 1-1 [Nymphaea thermarum]